METKEIAKAIIAVVVIIGIVLFATNAFGTTIIPGINDFFKNLLGNKITTEEETGSQANFNAFLSNIDSCLQKTQKDCLCEGLPDYPGTFARTTKLYFTISGTQTKIQLKSANNIMMSENKSAGIRTALLEKTGFNFNDALWDYDRVNEKWLDYSVEPPFLANSQGKYENTKLITGHLYKGNENNLLYLIITEDYSKFNETTLNALNKPICGK